MIDENRIYVVRVKATVETTLVTIAKREEEAIDKAEESLMDEVRNNGSDCICGSIDTVFCENIHPLDLAELLEELERK